MDFEISKLCTVLSKERHRIEDLYRSDEVFAEICDDLLLLMEIKEQSGNVSEDVQHSIDGLKAEI